MIGVSETSADADAVTRSPVLLDGDENDMLDKAGEIPLTGTGGDSAGGLNSGGGTGGEMFIEPDRLDFGQRATKVSKRQERVVG